MSNVIAKRIPKTIASVCLQGPGKDTIFTLVSKPAGKDDMQEVNTQKMGKS